MIILIIATVIFASGLIGSGEEGGGIALLFVAATLWFTHSLRSRIEKLEKIVKTNQGWTSEATAYVAPHAEVSQPTSLATGAQFSTPTVPENTEPSTGDSFTRWVKEDWLLKLGAFIVLLGFAWFVSYAFAHNWIGPLGRVTLGMLLGIVILGFGWVRMSGFPRQGSVFLGLGSMTTLISIFSAAHVYDFIPSHAALVVMLLTCAFTALASVRFKVKSLATSSIIIASIAPTTLLIGARPSFEELFAYLFIVLLGTMWVVVLTGWRSLTVVGLLMFILYSLPHFWVYSEGSTLLYFAFAFALLFFITNTIGILKNSDGDIRADAVCAAGNGLVLLLWITTQAPEEWQSLIITGWMLMFLVAAYQIFVFTKRKEPFFIYMGIGIAMLATATAVELEGAALTIAYILESAALPIIAYLIMQERSIAERLTLLLIGPAILSVGSMFAFVGKGEIPFDHFFVLLIMSITLLLLAIFFRSLPKEEGEGGSTGSLFVGSSIYAYILLWLSTHVIFTDDTATMISLVVYTVIGLMAYAYGKMHENKNLHYYGGVLLGFTVGHLLLIDVWDMEISGRIITFFLIGTLLMATAFIGRKKPLGTIQP